ncbi:MAG: SurA N-terminal domain-containing protein [Anaerolineae bacterium]|nr:SurA N-terminal domain-containing protein [Anaerolineae bacterium]
MPKNPPLPKTGAERKAAQKPVEPTRLQKALRLNPNRDLMSRQDKEAELGRFLFIGLGGALALIIVLVLIGVVVDGFIRPSQTVARINDQTISVAQFAQRVRLERAVQVAVVNNALNDAVEQFGVDVNTAAQSVLGTEPFATYYNELGSPEVMGLRVLDDMVDQALIEQYAAANGLTVTDEQIEQKINDVIGYDPEAVALIGAEPTATTEPTSTPTPFVSPTPTTEPTATPPPSRAASPPPRPSRRSLRPPPSPPAPPMKSARTSSSASAHWSARWRNKPTSASRPCASTSATWRCKT